MSKEKRLIDANALELATYHIEQESEYARGWNDALYAAQINAPSVDAVEVVRCKDCKHCDISLLLPSGRKMYTCMDGTHDHQMLMKPYDFCSNGKRKEGANNA